MHKYLPSVKKNKIKQSTGLTIQGINQLNKKPRNNIAGLGGMFV